ARWTERPVRSWRRPLRASYGGTAFRRERTVRGVGGGPRGGGGSGSAHRPAALDRAAAVAREAARGAICLVRRDGRRHHGSPADERGRAGAVLAAQQAPAP